MVVSNRDYVRRYCPDAHAEWVTTGGGYWSIRTNQNIDGAVGKGATEEEAWSDAAARLRSLDETQPQ